MLPSWSPGARAVLTAAAAVAVAAATLTCSPRPAPRSAAPAPARAGSQPGPPPPTGGLGIPSLAVEWTPPMLSAGDPGALAAALARHPEVAPALGPGLAGASWERRADDLVATLSPATRALAPLRAPATEVAGPEAELRTPRRDPAGGARPRYAAALQVQPGWAGRPATLAFDAAEIDLPLWQALPAVAVGSCEPAMRALAAGQETALAQLAPFLDHADALLGSAYRAELAAFVPEYTAALARFAAPRAREDFQAEEDWAAYQCGRAYLAHVEPYARCARAAEPCGAAPRLVLVGGARVAAPEPPLAVSERCPALVGRDYAAELRGLGRAAAESATTSLGRAWTVLADRLGTLTEVHAALEDVCTPRRRRFTEADVAEARARLARVGAALASDEVGPGAGRWELRDEPLHVPGLGPSRELARFVPGPASVNAGLVAEARALREFVLSRSLCRTGHAATPLTVLVAAAGQVEFFGYFFEEELFCGPLPPLR